MKVGTRIMQFFEMRRFWFWLMSKEIEAWLRGQLSERVF